MTTELTKALNTIEHLRASPLMENHRTGLDAAHALLSALITSQPAQATLEPRSLREVREDAQRARVMARAAKRVPSAASADFDLPAPNDAIQQATPEPVQADSSEHLRVIASMGAALRRLSFAAQTSGGTAGPDAELQAAIRQAEQALSFGGIAQAMFATPPQQAAGEPVGGTPQQSQKST